MTRPTQTVLVGALLIGAAVLSTMKRGTRCCDESQGGGACCPLVSSASPWPTNLWVPVESTNGKPAVMAGETITNRQR